MVDELIDWENFKDDPMFILNFPQKGMLPEDDFNRMADLILSGADKNTIKKEANTIREKLNPHPAGTTRIQCSRVKWRKTKWCTTQVQRNHAIFSNARSNLSRLLYFLFQMATVYQHGWRY